MPLQPCDLHEVSNCSICTGVDKAFTSSLEDAPLDGPRSNHRGLPPRIPGGPTIFSQFNGHCAGCGQPYNMGEPIHLNRELYDGWVGVSCCVRL